MRRITHAEVEEYRTTPDDWLANKLGRGEFLRTGYNGLVKLAIHHLHDKAGGDVEQAQRHLRALLLRRGFNNATRVRSSMDALAAYSTWYEESGTIVIDSKHRLSYPLNSEILFSGEISRIDLTLGGYRAILLGEPSPSWKLEPRLVLIQRAIATSLDRPENEISVGYQSIDGANLRDTKYSSEEIDSAEAVVIALATTAFQSLDDARTRGDG